MDKLLERLWNHVAQGASVTFHVRLFRLICLAVAFLCLGVVLPVNLLQRIHPLVHVGDVALGLFAWGCYRASIRGRDHVVLFFVVLVLLMDPVWFLNGGSQGSVTFYFFAAALYPLAICRGRVRWIMASFLVVNLGGLLVLEYLAPGLTVPFERPVDRLIDLVAGVFCSSLTTTLFAWVIIVNYDSEQKRLSRYARDLATSERNYREVVENANSFILRVDQNGTVRFFNRFAEVALGYNREEIIGRPLVGSVVPPVSRSGEDLAEAMRSVLQHPETHTQMQSETVARGGRRIDVSWTYQPVYDENQQLQEVLCVGADVTERIQAEERRRQSEQQMQDLQRLESLGVLAGGIAHDFNNLLTAVLGNIALAREGTLPGSEENELLRQAESASVQAKGLTAQLLTFARGGKPVKTTVSLGQIIQDSTSLALRGSAVKCELRLPADLWPVNADAAQLGQVFNNLVINAQQAMTNGGQIVIGARNRTITTADQPSVDPGPYLEVTVRDNGTGIAPHLLPKIFDLYFSTKKTGNGLGLAVVHSIIKNHCGSIAVESTVGVGTTFSLLFPASTQAVEGRLAPAEHPRPRSGRILVMDDDEGVRMLLRKMLLRQGHEVECVKDGAAAVNLYRDALSRSQSFDLVIMDLTIPGGMGGREAIQHLRDLDPGVKAIVSSGYSDGLDMADYKASGFSAVMPKP